MKCMSCNVEVPPSFVRSIELNCCPACGENILNDEAKSLMSEIADAFKRMENDPAGLAGWLLSNYTLTKVGTAEPTVFHRKSAPVNNRNVKVAENPVQKFLARTGIKAPQKPQRNIADIARMVNSGEVDEALYGGEEAEENYSEEQYDAESDYQEDGPSAREMLKNNSLVVPAPGQRPLSHEEIQEVLSAAGPDKGTSSQALEMMRRERIKKQQEIAGGGVADFGAGRGTFRRG